MPNITGRVGWLRPSYKPSSTLGSGAIDWGDGSGGCYFAETTEIAERSDIFLNLSKGSSVYKNNWAVQPYSIRYLPLVRT